jgi:hypothetical protein
MIGGELDLVLQELSRKGRGIADKDHRSHRQTSRGRELVELRLHIPARKIAEDVFLSAPHSRRYQEDQPHHS